MIFAQVEPTSEWTDPGVLVPVLAALVSLIGVLFVNYSSGKRLMHMEERRSIAAASERRMSELRESRRESYTRLVEWQHEVERNVTSVLPRNNEPWENWIVRASAWNADPSNSKTLYILVSEASVNGSPEQAWKAAIELSNHVVAVRNEVTYCITSGNRAYYTYLPNIWRGPYLTNSSALTAGIMSDLGIVAGPLPALEEMELLRVNAMLKRIRNSRTPRWLNNARYPRQWWKRRKATAARRRATRQARSSS